MRTWYWLGGEGGRVGRANSYLEMETYQKRQNRKEVRCLDFLCPEILIRPCAIIGAVFRLRGILPWRSVTSLRMSVPNTSDFSFIDRKMS
jgi:hypothetical protein